VKSAAYTITLPVFTGPLDLLLELIERAELDITKVALAQVTDQYLARLRQLPEQNLQEIADFLVIAAKLILIKSEMLLPRPPQRTPDEEDPGEELARMLLAYKAFKQVAGSLEDRQRRGWRTYVRTATPVRAPQQFNMAGANPLMLWQAFAKLLDLLPADAPAVATVISQPRVTIVSQFRWLVTALRTQAPLSFFELLRPAQNRVTVIVTFLAMLEMLKQRLITAEQKGCFGDIEISPLGDWVAQPDYPAFLAELETESDSEMLPQLHQLPLKA
jgi:segregation and condensation protein A